MSEKIRQFIVEYISKKSKLPQNVNLDALNYIDTGYIDSMGLIKFMVEIERHFNIELDEDDMMLPEFKTIGGLIGIINKKMA